MLKPLPIDVLMPKIVNTFLTCGSLILKASPGAGKTTRVPSQLLRAPWLNNKKILVLEPRRLAAKLSAYRVSEELNTKVGDEVGYEFRFERKTSSSSRLIFLTEGLLMRKMLKDPLLSDVGLVVLDEFHERHVHGDIALSLLKSLQEGSRPDLKILVMSATMDTTQLTQYLKEAPVLEQELPPHPLEVLHLESDDSWLEKKCVKGLRLALDSKYEGDILLFLPGMAEIRKVESQIQSLKLPQLRTFVLHGEISQEEQEAALTPQKGVRKVILSTNIAETSITIEGVSIVIDSGLERRAVVDEWTQITELQTKKISQASARQRMGRAARRGPGLCIRLYTKGEFDSLLPFTPPEIQRSDLTRTYLELLALGVKDVKTFPWYEAPRTNLLQGAVDLLESLGAITKNKELTPLGQELAEIPASPRISRVLIEAKKLKCVEDAAWLVAGLSEGQLPKGEIFVHLNEMKRSFYLKKTVTQLLKSIESSENQGSHEDSLTQCLLRGFPDRIGKRKAEKTAKHVEYVLSSGGVALLERDTAPDSPFLLILEAKKNDFGKTYIHSYSSLDLDTIFDTFSEGIKETVFSTWDKEKERVVSSSQLLYGNLTLTESKIPTPSGPECAKVLLEEGLKISLKQSYNIRELTEKLAPLFPTEQWDSVLGRIELFQKYYTNQDALPLTEKTLLDFILQELEKHYSLTTLKNVDWKSELLSYYLSSQYSKLDQKFPESFTLSNSRKMKVTYALGSAPKSSIKMQELFGMKQLPQIADGKIGILLEILGPNYRPVQVTSDLMGFWQRSYPTLRKELSRKYPRHKWPEDPLVVQPLSDWEKKHR